MPPVWSASAKRAFQVLSEAGYVAVAATETTTFGSTNRLEVTVILGDRDEATKDEGK